MSLLFSKTAGPARPAPSKVIHYGSPCQSEQEFLFTRGDPEAGCADMGIRLKTNHTRLYGLNLSRCLGDKFLKNEDLGLSAEPSISPVLRFDPCQQGIAVLASDGLWDVMESGTAMQVTLLFLSSMRFLLLHNSLSWCTPADSMDPLAPKHFLHIAEEVVCAACTQIGLGAL